VLENLDRLRDNAKKDTKFNKKLTLRLYYRAHFCIEYEVKERGLRALELILKGPHQSAPRAVAG